MLTKAAFTKKPPLLFHINFAFRLKQTLIESVFAEKAAKINKIRRNRRKNEHKAD